MYITKRQANILRKKVAETQRLLVSQKEEIDILGRVLANGGTYGIKVDTVAERDYEVLRTIRRLETLNHRLSISVIE